MPIRVIKSPNRGSEAVQRMLDSGNFKLGPNGELLRVSAEEANQAALQQSREAAYPEKYSPTTSGFMTPERKEYLENVDRRLTPEEAREYATVSFDPSEGPNMVFGAVAGEAPMEPVALLAGQAIKRAGDAYRVLKTPVENMGVGLASAEPSRVGTLKKSGYKGPKINTGFIPSRKPPEDIFSPAVVSKHTPREGLVVDEVASEGNEFVRRYFADPQVQDHYRKTLIGSNPTASQMQDAINLDYEDAAMISKKQLFDLDYDVEESNKIYRNALHPDFNEERYAQTLIEDNDATKLEALFLRGQRAPDTTLDFDGSLVGDAAAGMYRPLQESVAINPKFRGDKSTAAHEAQHFVDANFLRSDSDIAKKVSSGISESVNPKLQQYVKDGSGRDALSRSELYLASTPEITARTRELQRSVAEILLNNPSNNPNIKALSQEDRVAFLLGDFSKLDESSIMNVFRQAFQDNLSKGKIGIVNMFNDVLKGGKAVDFSHSGNRPISQMNINNEKKEAISNLFKYSLAASGAGVAYGAMDPDQQPPQGMSFGGKMRVNKTQPMKVMKR